MQIKENTRVVMDAVIASNHSRKPSDTSTALSIGETTFPAEYDESIAIPATVVHELKALHEQGHITQQIALQVLEEAQQIKDRPKLALRDLPHMLQVYGTQLETLDLNRIPLDDLTLEALAEATREGSSLKYLSVGGARDLGDRRIQALASIAAQSALHHLDINLETEDARAHILESIQWRHIRKLELGERHRHQGVGMRALIDGMKKMSEMVQLEHLSYGATRATEHQRELLRQFVSLLSLKGFDLHVPLTCEQLLDLLRSVDLTRLERFYQPERWNSSEVQLILDALQHATQLRIIILPRAAFTMDQKEQMHIKGIKLTA
ncbi:hypothetical protein BGZ68_001971 [Mortierella alpina]|nr:hypothetical protein BGZ68_001971 [Mortierella alpina]